MGQFFKAILIVAIIITASGMSGLPGNASSVVASERYSTGYDTEWAFAFGGPGQDVVRGIAVDDMGNVYLTGKFTATIDFDPGPGVDQHNSKGELDAFLSKFDSSGEFIWARTWGGSNTEIGYGVDLDKSGNAYVCGRFKGAADFDPGIEYCGLRSADRLYSFLSKFDSEGNFQWARSWGGTGYTTADNIACDFAGNAYVIGSFTESADLDPGLQEELHISSGDRDSYISKFDTAGNVIWTRTWGGVGSDWCSGVDLDSKGNIYVNGGFDDNVDFDPGDGTAIRTAYGLRNNTHLSKFDAGGNFIWVQTWNGRCTLSGPGISVNNMGEIYLAGTFWDAVDLDPTYLIDRHVSNAFLDLFLGGFNSSGELTLAMAWGGSYYETISEVAADGNRQIYVMGTFQGEMDFDPGCGSDIHTSRNSKKYFLSSFDTSGWYQWTGTWDCPDGDIGAGVAVDDSGGVYVAGTFNDTFVLDDYGEPYESTGAHDIFLLKLIPTYD